MKHNWAGFEKFYILKPWNLKGFMVTSDTHFFKAICNYMLSQITLKFEETIIGLFQNSFPVKISANLFY